MPFFFAANGVRPRRLILHMNWTEWKNLFSFEYSECCGKLEITCLGQLLNRAPGALRYPVGSGPPETTIYEYPAADNSWETKMADFSDDIRLHRTPLPSITAVHAVSRIAMKFPGGRQS